MRNNLKIFQVVDSLNVGGSERMSVNICNTLNANNIDNHLVVTRNSGPLYNFIEDIKKVHFLNKKNVLDCIAFYKLFKLVRAHKPSLIHVHQTSIYWIFIVKLFYPKIKIVWHDHWGFSDLLKDSDRKLIKKISFLIDGVVCVNDKIKKWNIKNLKVNEKSIVFIRNYPLLKPIARNENKECIIVCVANIRDQKDHPNLLKACAILKEQKIEFKLLLVGSLEDNLWVDKVRQIIIDLNLSNEVELLGPMTEISKILSQASIGVLSSVSEGLPVSLLEYGLVGLPVVCTNVGQCSEVLGGGEYGWLVPVKSPEKLAESIKEAIENPTLAKKKSIKLKNNIDENYGAKDFINKYLSFIGELV